MTPDERKEWEEHVWAWHEGYHAERERVAEQRAWATMIPDDEMGLD